MLSAESDVLFRNLLVTCMKALPTSIGGSLVLAFPLNWCSYNCYRWFQKRVGITKHNLLHRDLNDKFTRASCEKRHASTHFNQIGRSPKTCCNFASWNSLRTRVLQSPSFANVPLARKNRAPHVNVWWNCIIRGNTRTCDILRPMQMIYLEAAMVGGRIRALLSFTYNPQFRTTKPAHTCKSSALAESTLSRQIVRRSTDSRRQTTDCRLRKRQRSLKKEKKNSE